MSPTTGELVRIIETAIFDLTDRSPRLCRLPFTDIRYRCLDYPHPLANILGAARLDAESVEQAIAESIAYFSSRGCAFSWRTGPYSTPADLGDRLLANGFRPGPEIKGMVLALNGADPNPESGLVVRRAAASDREAVGRLIESAYPLPGELACALGELFIELTSAETFALYLAFVPDSESGAGLAALYLPDEAVAVFPAAAVLPGLRRRGIYRRLLQYRMIEAARRGCRYVAMQAVAGTSAPICRRMGFTEVCTIDSYEWYPR